MVVRGGDDAVIHSVIHQQLEEEEACVSIREEEEDDLAWLGLIEVEWMIGVSRCERGAHLAFFCDGLDVWMMNQWVLLVLPSALHSLRYRMNGRRFSSEQAF